MGAPRYLTSSDLGGLYSGGSSGTTDRAPRCQPRTALAQNLFGGGRARRPRGAGSSSEPPVLMRYEWWSAFATVRRDTFLPLLRRDRLRKKARLPRRSSPKEAAGWRGAKSGAEERTRTSTALRQQAPEAQQDRGRSQRTPDYRGPLSLTQAVRGPLWTHPPELLASSCKGARLAAFRRGCEWKLVAGA